MPIQIADRGSGRGVYRCHCSVNNRDAATVVSRSASKNSVSDTENAREVHSSAIAGRRRQGNRNRSRISQDAAA